MDQAGTLVVIELKRTEDGGHMELQALRYAAMVSTMKWHQAVEAHAKFRTTLGKSPDEAEAELLTFLDWGEPQPEFGQKVRVVLVSPNFDPEITTTVIWLNSLGLDIQCVRLSLYQLENRHLMDIQTIIPLPEAGDYMVRIREKQQEVATTREQNRDFTRYDVILGEEVVPNLNKRHAILETVRLLLENGVNPQQIDQAVPWRKPGRPLWVGVDGHGLDEQGFLEALVPGDALAQVEKKKRLFTADEELLHADGRTYAVSKMWGSDTEKALNDFRAMFGGMGLDFREAT